MNRPTLPAILRKVNRLEEPVRMQALLAVERQLSGVFGFDELNDMARVVDPRGRTFGGFRRGGSFDELPSTPRLDARTVAVAPAVLEGRLLALLPLASREPPPEAPDSTLAKATNYSRANMRRALNRTLRAIGLAPTRPRYPQRSSPVGDTAREGASFERKRRKSAHRAQRRALARAGLVS